MATFLTRTNSSAVTAERKLFTISFWVKRCATGVEHALCSAGNGGGSEEFSIRFNTSDQLDCFHYTGSFVGRLVTNRLFRDTNAWYHIYFLYDSANGTAGDRMQLYINGVRETSFSTQTNPTQNDLLPWNVNERHQIGNNSWGGGSANGALDGCMSHFYNVAGSNIAVTQFGSTDATTGEWKINTSPTISSYGTNGFLVLKDGNTATDQSPNSNDFTITGTLTNTEDCPSNVFPVLNQLNPQASGYTFDGLGSLSVTGNTGDGWRTMYATFGASSGKYYWEQKITNFTGTDPHYIGIVSDDQMSNTNIDQATTSRGYFYTATGGKRNNNSQTSYGDSWTTNDIVGVALDLDNSKVFFSKNGVFQNSGDPANGTNPAFTITSGYTYIPATSTYYNLNRYDMNFGNGSFGTSAISSEGTNASNIGKFEYDVPTGYTALSTKGLNE